MTQGLVLKQVNKWVLLKGEAVSFVVVAIASLLLLLLLWCCLLSLRKKKKKKSTYQRKG